MKLRLTAIAITALLAYCSVSLAVSLDAAGKIDSDRIMNETANSFTTNSTIDDYLDYAFKNNPALKAAEKRAAAKDASADQSGYLNDPALSFEYMIEQHDMQYRIGLTQSVPGFGKLRLRKRSAKEMAESADHDVEAVRLMVFEMVIKAFHNYHYLGRSIQVTEDNLALLKDLEKVIMSEYKAKSASYSDLLKVQVEKDNMLDHHASLQEMRSVMSSKLSLLLDLPDDKALPWPKLTSSASTALPVDVLKDMLEDLNPELKAMDSKISSLDSAVKLAKRERYPDYFFGLGYHVMPKQPDGSEPEDYGVMAGITLPLWFGRTSAAVREAELNRKSAAHMRRNMANDLFLELKQALFDLNDAERQVKLFEESLIPKSQQAFEVAKREFTSGETNFMTLIDAQRTLFSLNLSLARAKANREIAIGEIGCCIGKYDLDSFIENTNDKEKGK